MDPIAEILIDLQLLHRQKGACQDASTGFSSTDHAKRI